MPKNMRDVKTLAYVLRRTNFGEADRILNLITPEGKMSAIAKGVRKEKSKLAGGVEMFSLTELNLHFGKSEMATVTGAKMLAYYGNILADFGKLELAAIILKKISLAAESSDAPEYFKLADSCLKGLNAGVASELVESWFLINLSKTLGEEVNLYRDVGGEKLRAGERYSFMAMENAFLPNVQGEYGEDEIKIMRLMLVMELAAVARVKNVEKSLPVILRFARITSKMI